MRSAHSSLRRILRVTYEHIQYIIVQLPLVGSVVRLRTVLIRYYRVVQFVSAMSMIPMPPC